MFGGAPLACDPQSSDIILSLIVGCALIWFGLSRLFSFGLLLFLCFRFGLFALFGARPNSVLGWLELVWLGFGLVSFGFDLVG